MAFSHAICYGHQPLDLLRPFLLTYVTPISPHICNGRFPPHILWPFPTLICRPLLPTYVMAISPKLSCSPFPSPPICYCHFHQHMVWPYSPIYILWPFPITCVTANVILICYGHLPLHILRQFHKNMLLYPLTPHMLWPVPSHICYCHFFHVCYGNVPPTFQSRKILLFLDDDI